MSSRSARSRPSARAGEEDNMTISPIPKTRGYQQEMLDESIRRNIVIALDTGAGKTHIAVLRMKSEVERQSRKLCWFLVPTVALAHQQHRVISNSLPVNVGLISGANEPDQWKDIMLWERVVNDYGIVVTTHAVLLNALHHGYINLGRDVNLIVFDEAHHTRDKHPYNLIMKNFYFPLPPRPSGEARLTVPSDALVRPMILGLTASPIFGGDVEKAFREIEANLDCTIRAPLLHRAELAGFVHRPEFHHVTYAAPEYVLDGPPPAANLASLKDVVSSLDINNDPSVKSLRNKLQSLQPGSPEHIRTDQRLSRAIRKEDTYTHKGLRDFHRAADEICMELGTWAADWYIFTIIEQLQRPQNRLSEVVSTLSSAENRYLMDTIGRVETTQPSYDPQAIVVGCSDKVRALAETLLEQKTFFERFEEDYRGLVFVTRRDVVLALSELLRHHPQTAGRFQIGCLLGNSSDSRRHAFLDVTRHLLQKDSNTTLDEFRAGELDLIVATAVAEEGLDIQACCSVVRWDPPPNMVSWAQSRGRARQKRSVFVLMFQHDVGNQKIEEWRELEERMRQLYTQDRARTEPEDDGDEDNPRVFKSPTTGALLTLNSAIEHLNHFCAILPWSGRSAHQPIFDIFPLEFPPEWHSNGGDVLYPTGPFGCTVTLPLQVDASFRIFTTPEIHRSKMSARRHVAFEAYLTLYKKGLLNDHLLPLMSTLEPGRDDEVKQLLKEVEKRPGTERVTSQMDPWLPSLTERQAWWPSSTKKEVWWSSEIRIFGIPSMRLLTLRPLAQLTDDEMPVLHSMDHGSFRVHVHSEREPCNVDDDILNQARVYTRRILTPLYGTRLKWEKIDFAFLFLPWEPPTSSPWDERCAIYSENPTISAIPAQPLFARAEWFGNRFQHPHDVFIVSEIRRYGKLYRFLRWRMTPVTDKEREELVGRYDPDGVGGVDITYPLLEATPLRHRMNFLAPIPPEAKGDDAASQRPVLFLPQHAAIGLISSSDAQLALWAPSILRSLAMANTAIAMREACLRPSLGKAIMSLDLILEAITAPVAQEQSHYQRLEMLGDCVLKFLVSLNLLAEHRYWHEGYLARRKDHAVSNTSLAKAAMRKKLYLWIIRDRFSPRRWTPEYSSTLLEPALVGVYDSSVSERKRQDLSTKVLADVVEATIGAAYIHGSFDLATACINIFDVGFPLQPLVDRAEQMRSRAEDFNHYPIQLTAVEEIIGYNFERRSLLIEALTHASYQSDLSMVSYERMEFLGDAVLDMIVTDYLYHVPGKRYSPGQMHFRKMAVVNAHFLAAMCLRAHTTGEARMPYWTQNEGVQVQSNERRTYLWQCLLHSSVPVLDEQHIAFARWESPRGRQRIERDLEHGTSFPWAPLMALQAPKFLSDMVESILGAIFVDTHGSLDACRNMLVRLGVLQILERIVRDDVHVQDPISSLRIWAARRQETIEIHVPRRTATCTIRWDGFELLKVEEEWRGHASQEDARFAAAERALQLLKDPVSRLKALSRKLEQRLQYIIEEDIHGKHHCGVILGDIQILQMPMKGDEHDDMRRIVAVEALKRLEDPLWRLATYAAVRETEYEFVWDTEKGGEDEVPTCALFVGGIEVARKKKQTKRFVREEVERALAKRAMIIMDERDRLEAEECDEGAETIEVDMTLVEENNYGYDSPRASLG
ncbi:P-loop containing nucleoside triphosphate hydrolase protein [Vararia minispora EC-137]|uniref:P-loop containing nucleoside triphosphate hydrolase protein n=1 Tax=Vararia minispora EC-137 TaxID=1314806 RepID=A0ACB8QMZ7_9AGAM|nr:P-loop containing nucleoside triphosphate hydrolase protein [Vararia minispora EC-137]